MRHRDDYDLIVLYEDILDDPENVCKRLLEACDVPLKYFSRAMEALKTDSQQGTFGIRGERPRATRHALDLSDLVFKECGLPIKSNMEVEEFRKLIVSGAYSMRSEHDWPSRDYKKIQGFEKWIFHAFGIRVLPFVWMSKQRVQIPHFNENLRVIRCAISLSVKLGSKQVYISWRGFCWFLMWRQILYHYSPLRLQWHQLEWQSG